MFVFGLMIPLGLLLLVLSIKHTVKVYTVTATHDMPYRTDKGIFTIQTAGRYGIWLNGNRFKKAPLGLFGVQLINCETEKEVPLRANLIPVSVTKVIDVRLELYTFYAMVHLFLSIWGFIFGVIAVMWGIAGLVIH